MLKFKDHFTSFDSLLSPRSLGFFQCEKKNSKPCMSLYFILFQLVQDLMTNYPICVHQSLFCVKVRRHYSITLSQMKYGSIWNFLLIVFFLSVHQFLIHSKSKQRKQIDCIPGICRMTHLYLLISNIWTW